MPGRYLIIRNLSVGAVDRGKQSWLALRKETYGCLWSLQMVETKFRELYNNMKSSGKVTLELSDDFSKI